ncbi:MAG: response regulator transcription factor [Calditrichia bacterium]
MINVAIVEDKDYIREGLVMLIESTEDIRCIGAYGDCESMLASLKKIVPDVLLMDIHLPGISGIEGVRQVKKIVPNQDIIMLTVLEERDSILEALCAGATGYLVKNTESDQLLSAIREAHAGGSPMNAHIARKVVKIFHDLPLKTISRETDAETENVALTSRELEVLNGLSAGESYQSIADALFVSANTVRYHIRNIYRKLHVHSQSEAVAKALKSGLI